MTVGRLARDEALVAVPRRTTRPALVVLAGLAVLMLTWVLVIPPFGGSDEFDHAYRAAAAARGQWLVTPSAATRGTGAWLEVPGDIVAAARPQCAMLEYTVAADCVGTVRGDSVRIASGAGRYNPVFYAVVGSAALPFHGDVALYVMRLATIALALALMWLVLVAIGSWARSRLAMVGPVVACTPVLVYSCAIVAPNGLEMVSALGFWCSAVGLLVAERARLRQLSVLAAVSGVTLCTLRPLGPWWCLLVAMAVLAAVRPAAGRLAELWRRRDVRLAALAVVVSAALGSLWTIAMGALTVGGVADHHTSVAHRMAETLWLVALWPLQTIAAFPLRDQPTSPLVYLCYLLLFAAILGWALRRGGRRIALTLAAVAVVSLALPYATTVSSYDRYGDAWQGRYGLPLSVGLAVLAAYALDRRHERVPTPVLLTGGALFVVAQVVSLSHTLGYEELTSPLVHSSAWLRPGTWLVIVLGVAGSVLMWSALVGRIGGTGPANQSETGRSTGALFTEKQGLLHETEDHD